MSKAVRVIIIVGVLVLIVVALLIRADGSRSRNALAAYKAGLRAKGEKLTWKELGYPRQAEGSYTAGALQDAVAKLPKVKADPGQLSLMKFVGPARVETCFSLERPVFGWRSGTNAQTWADFEADLIAAQDALEDIRAAVRNPSRRFFLDPADFLNRPQAPLVELRRAAQWLVAEVVGSLHSNRLDRAQADLHALTQLAQLHREDMNLVSQMIRVAIGNLALAVNWEALQLAGWDEVSLGRLQHDWEDINLIDGLRMAMFGERAQGEEFFSWAQTVSVAECVSVFKFAPPSGRATAKSFGDYFDELVRVPIWRANSATDERFFLEYHQRNLDWLRRLEQIPWSEVQANVNAHYAQLDKTLAEPWSGFRYLLSFIALPNLTRAANVVVHAETQRRLTVAAIAIERFRLRHFRPPADLNALIPQFLSAVPIDPMSAKPMCYHLNADGTFTLYSAGDDGRDDGGDASTPGVTNKWDFWTGRDAVWPGAVPPTPATQPQ